MEENILNEVVEFYEKTGLSVLGVELLCDYLQDANGKPFFDRSNVIVKAEVSLDL